VKRPRRTSAHQRHQAHEHGQLRHRSTDARLSIHTNHAPPTLKHPQPSSTPNPQTPPTLTPRRWVARRKQQLEEEARIMKNVRGGVRVGWGRGWVGRLRGVGKGAGGGGRGGLIVVKREGEQPAASRERGGSAVVRHRFSPTPALPPSPPANRTPAPTRRPQPPPPSRLSTLLHHPNSNPKPSAARARAGPRLGGGREQLGDRPLHSGAPAGRHLGPHDPVEGVVVVTRRCGFYVRHTIYNIHIWLTM